MSTQYEITINMSESTVNSLEGGKYSLYGFKAVRATTGAGVPLVWFRSVDYATETQLTWAEQYQAYTSTQQAIPSQGGVITAFNSYGIDLDETLNVTGTKGTGAVVQGGTVGAIAINNKTSTPFIAGLSQVKPNEHVATPMCAFPLYGNQLDLIVPIEKVLLMFSSVPVNTGTVVEQAYSQGVLIDLTGGSPRTVSFDMNGGWSWEDAPWGSKVEPNAELVPLLILGAPTLHERSAAARRAALLGG